MRVIWVRFVLALIAAILFCPGAISQPTSSQSNGKQIIYYTSALLPGFIESSTFDTAIANAKISKQFKSIPTDTLNNQPIPFTVTFVNTGQQIVSTHSVQFIEPKETTSATVENATDQLSSRISATVTDKTTIELSTVAKENPQISSTPPVNIANKAITLIPIVAEKSHHIVSTPLASFPNEFLTLTPYTSKSSYELELTDSSKTIYNSKTSNPNLQTEDYQNLSSLNAIRIYKPTASTPTVAVPSQQLVLLSSMPTVQKPDHQIVSTLTATIINQLRTTSPTDALLSQQTTGEKPDHQIVSTEIITITNLATTSTSTVVEINEKTELSSSVKPLDNQIVSTTTASFNNMLTASTPPVVIMSKLSISTTATPTVAVTDQQVVPTKQSPTVPMESNPIVPTVSTVFNQFITAKSSVQRNQIVPNVSTYISMDKQTAISPTVEKMSQKTVLTATTNNIITASDQISGYRNVPTHTVSVTNQPLASTMEEMSRQIISTPSSMINNQLLSTTITIEETGHKILSSYTISVFTNNQASISTDKVVSQNIVPNRTGKITLESTDSKVTAASSKQTVSYQTRTVSNFNLPDTSISNFGVTSQQIISIPSVEISNQQTKTTLTFGVTDKTTTQSSLQPSEKMTESNIPSQSEVIDRTITSMPTESINQSIKPSKTVIASNQATTSPPTDYLVGLSTSSLPSVTRIEQSTTETLSRKSTINSTSRSQGVSQSMTPTVPTSTTTQLPLTKSPNHDATVNVPVTLFLNRSTNTSSEKNVLREQLQEQYKNVTGYIGINIYIFRLVPETEISNSRRRRQAENKLKVAYNVIIALFKLNEVHNLKETGKISFDDIKKQTTELFNNQIVNDLAIDQKSSTVDRLTEVIEKITENISQLLCGLGYTFDETSKICQSRCLNITCKNKGSCILDISGNAVCRCKKDGKYVFAGDFCGTKGERLLLASEYIIAAACGSGGIIIIVAIVICFICKGRKPKDRTEKDYYITDQASLSYNHPMGFFGRQRIPSNMYFSMRDSTYNVDDRRYTVIEDVTSKRGNTYIYNPSSEPSANTEIDNRSDNVYYNKSFCSEEFAIKRPHLRTERDSFHSDFNRPKIHRPDYM